MQDDDETSREENVASEHGHGTNARDGLVRADIRSFFVHNTATNGEGNCDLRSSSQRKRYLCDAPVSSPSAQTSAPADGLTRINMCGATFPSIATLQRHRQKAHGLKPIHGGSPVQYQQMQQSKQSQQPQQVHQEKGNEHEQVQGQQQGRQEQHVDEEKHRKHGRLTKVEVVEVVDIDEDGADDNTSTDTVALNLYNGVKSEKTTCSGGNRSKLRDTNHLKKSVYELQLWFCVSALTGRVHLYDAQQQSLAQNFLPEDLPSISTGSSKYYRSK
jgi:hypothetical protein